MNLRDEEILQQYFDRKMTGQQEQNFLIDVAARDDMRLAFRSNLELLKAVRADKDAAAIAMVRSSTLASLGLGAGLLPNALKEQEVAQAAMLAPRGFSLWNLVRRPASMLVMGLLAGSALTYSLLPGTTATTSSITAPATTTSPSTIIITEPAKDIAPVTQRENLKPTEQLRSAKAVTKNVVAAAPKKSATTEEMPIVKKTKPGSILIETNVNPPSENQK